MNFSRFSAFSAITGSAKRKNSLQMRRFRTIAEFSHSLGRIEPFNRGRRNDRCWHKGDDRASGPAPFPEKGSHPSGRARCGADGGLHHGVTMAGGNPNAGKARPGVDVNRRRGSGSACAHMAPSNRTGRPFCQGGRQSGTLHRGCGTSSRQAGWPLENEVAPQS
jgi:hypothetical protein